MEGMTGRGAMSPVSGLICEISNSVGQGNFAFVRKEKVSVFQKPLALATMISFRWHAIISSFQELDSTARGTAGYGSTGK